MHLFKDSIGYLLGLCIFVLGIPALMWWVSERPCPYLPESPLRCVLAVFLVQAILLTLQVRSEEKRLEKDFGEAYLSFKRRTGRYLPFSLCKV